MKKIIPTVIVYLIVCLIAIFLPASEGYNDLGWKLLVGQIYELPISLVTFFILIYRGKKKST